MEKIIGLINAPFTPFYPNGDVNYEPIQAYANMLVKNGLIGVFINGSSGEGYMLTTEERMLLAEKWVSVVPKGFKVIVHVGSCCLALRTCDCNDRQLLRGLVEASCTHLRKCFTRVLHLDECQIFGEFFHFKWEFVFIFFYDDSFRPIFDYIRNVFVGIRIRSTHRDEHCALLRLS